MKSCTLIFFKSTPGPPPSPYLVQIQDCEFTGTFDLIPNIVEDIWLELFMDGKPKFILQVILHLKMLYLSTFLNIHLYDRNNQKGP